MARSHGLVVMADGSWLRSCGFKTQHRILDGCKQFVSYFIKEKLKIKVAKQGTLKKYLKKNKTQNGVPSLQILPKKHWPPWILAKNLSYHPLYFQPCASMIWRTGWPFRLSVFSVYKIQSSSKLRDEMKKGCYDGVGDYVR